MPRSTRSTAKRTTSTAKRTTPSRTAGKRTGNEKPKATSAPKRSRPPTDEAIRRRAFEKYEARASDGSVSDGHQQVEDWLEAEAELAAKPRKR